MEAAGGEEELSGAEEFAEPRLTREERMVKFGFLPDQDSPRLRQHKKPKHCPFDRWRRKMTEAVSFQLLHTKFELRSDSCLHLRLIHALNFTIQTRIEQY